MSCKTFSIIVPSYNHGQFIGATLDSILSQNDVSLEVIVFDGGSTDNTIEVLESFKSDERLTWHSERDLGQAHAINKGLRIASGRILAYLNSDDVYFPDSLRQVQTAFDESPDSIFVYGDAYHLNEDGSILEPYPTEPWDYERLMRTCILCQPAVFWRRGALDRFGYFDDTLHFAMDYEYWLRTGKHVAFNYLKGKFLAGSRLHAETKTLSQRIPVHSECFEVLSRHTRDPAVLTHWLAHVAHHESVVEASTPGKKGYSLPRELIFARNLLRSACSKGILLDTQMMQRLQRIAEHNTP